MKKFLETNNILSPFIPRICQAKSFGCKQEQNVGRDQTMFILLTEIYINSNHYREKNSWKINLINFVRLSSPQKPLIWWICKLRSFLNREFTVTVLHISNSESLTSRVFLNYCHSIFQTFFSFWTVWVLNYLCNLWFFSSEEKKTELTNWGICIFILFANGF